MNRTELGLLGSGFALGVLSVIIVQLLVGRLESGPQQLAATMAAQPLSATMAKPTPSRAANLRIGDSALNWRETQDY